MKPADALRLPNARLTVDQRNTVARAIELLEDLYARSMTRSGISVDMQCDDLVILYELERHCRSEGWITYTAPDWTPPRIQGGQPTLHGFKLTLTPPREAYEEVDAETAKTAETLS